MKRKLNTLLCRLRRRHSYGIDCQFSLILLDKEWFNEHIHYCLTCNAIVMVNVARLEPYDPTFIDPGLPISQQQRYMN